MSIKPAGSIVIINGQSLIVDSISGPMPDVQFFERMEFSNSRLRQALNADGSHPVFIELLGGKLIQYNNGCNPNDTIRPLEPDDANYDYMYRRFDIQRWEMRGAASIASSVQSVYSTAEAHKILLNMFQAFLQSAKAEVSYGFLVGLQSYSVSYLTSSGITTTGMPLGDGTATGSISNCLITSFSMSPEYEEPMNSLGTVSRVLRSWNASIETRIETYARNTSA